MMTLTAQQVENVMPKTTNVIYGLSAARHHLVLMEMVIVIIILIVQEHSSVAMTTVQVDQLEWTAVQMMVFEQGYFFVRDKYILYYRVYNCSGQ